MRNSSAVLIILACLSCFVNVSPEVLQAGCLQRARVAPYHRGAPLKLPGAGEVLVKVEARGICFSDMFAQKNVMGGGFPLVHRQEIIGRVAAVSDGVS
ncbi:hypothetical protein F4820DRAFT_88854 [Hypoxylon rubiginosum]|uniref:Uncharacterized protein n=1 Tax=Hypoxylon rubiginosum TaxID=110542 RepID=A0ACB9ZAI7_9PEZI|nr:hypothetical protein F4820DRAFT_88854 [Hypoxylon rubiginosum]